VLTTAELSFQPERHQCYENLSNRTARDSVKSVSQVLIQAERYGTPVTTALRVLSQKSREMRMNKAEKKAAALPLKLTVSMILYLPACAVSSFSALPACRFRKTAVSAATRHHSMKA
jgi:tight adherence protein C